MYLLVMGYGSDAERKRIDYAIERQQGKLSIQKPNGTTILVEGNDRDIDEFYEDICARLENSEHKVDIYKLNTYEPEVEKEKSTLSYDTTEDKKFVKKFIDYLMTKLSASYEYSDDMASTYKVYTKKGQAELTVAIKGKDSVTHILVEVEGYGGVVEFVSNKINREMKTFLEER